MLGIDLVDLAGWQLGLTLFSTYLGLSLSLGLGLFLLAKELLTTNEESLFLQRWRRLLNLSLSWRVVTHLLLLAQLGLNTSYLVYFAGDVLALPVLIDFLVGSWLSVVAAVFYARNANRLIRILSLLVLIAGFCVSQLALALVWSWLEQPTGALFNSVGYRLELTDPMALLNHPLLFSKWLHLTAASIVMSMAAIMAFSALSLRRNVQSARTSSVFHFASRIGALALLVLLGSGQGSASVAFTTATLEGNSQLNVIKGKIERGVLAHKALLALRDNDTSPNIRAEFEQNQADLGYSWLLLPIHKSIADAEPRHIQMAVQAALPRHGALVLWAYRLMVFIGGFAGLWFAYGLLQPWLGEWTKRRLTWFIHGAPLPILAMIAGWLASGLSLSPWLIYGVLPANLAISSLTTKEFWFSLLLCLMVHSGLLVAFIRHWQNSFQQTGASA